MSSGWRFPIPDFFQELATFYQLNLSQLSSPSFQIICGTVILFRLYQIPLTAPLFDTLYVVEIHERGVFSFVLRSGHTLICDLLTTEADCRSISSMFNLLKHMLGRPIRALIYL